MKTVESWQLIVDSWQLTVDSNNYDRSCSRDYIDSSDSTEHNYRSTENIKQRIYKPQIKWKFESKKIHIMKNKYQTWKIPKNTEKANNIKC